jgi:hypothetical protein
MFIVLVSIMDLAVFVPTLAYDGLNPFGGFLAPTRKALLIFGEKVRPLTCN